MPRHVPVNASPKMQVVPACAAAVALVMAWWLVLDPAHVASAQNARPQFDAASVKRSGAGGTRPNVETPLQYVRAARVIDLIAYAYPEVLPFQIIGGDDWIRSEQFQVTANTSVPTTQDTKRLMVRSLLEDRFALRVKRDTRTMPRFRLALARSDGRTGRFLRQSSLDCRPYISGLRPMTQSPLDAQGRLACSRVRVTRTGALDTLSYRGIPMSLFAHFLQANMGRAVTDHTGLDGLFDIDFTFSLSTAPGLSLPVRGQSEEIVSITTALRDDLGLTLEEEHGPVELLVIEAAKFPDPD